MKRATYLCRAVREEDRETELRLRRQRRAPVERRALAVRSEVDRRDDQDSDEIEDLRFERRHDWGGGRSRELVNDQRDVGGETVQVEESDEIGELRSKMRSIGRGGGWSRDSVERFERRHEERWSRWGRPPRFRDESCRRWDDLKREEKTWSDGCGVGFLFFPSSFSTPFRDFTSLYPISLSYSAVEFWFQKVVKRVLIGPLSLHLILYGYQSKQVRNLIFGCYSPKHIHFTSFLQIQTPPKGWA